MKLSQLIAEIGDDNVEFQLLSSCMTGNQKQRKGHVEITFATPAVSLIDLVSDKCPKMGFVVWLPADKVSEIHNRLKGGAA
jgi:hypothetical protein